MTSTRQTIILRRMSQYLAAATVAIGFVLGSATVTSAEWDIEYYDKCVRNLGNPNVLGSAATSVWECCVESGGDPQDPVFDPAHACAAPPENDAMTGQPAPPRSPEDIVTGPTRQFNVPDASVPGAPIVVPTP